MSTIINETNSTTPTNPTTRTVGTTRNKNLQFVEDLSDYKVHHDDVDIRGYNIKLASGETIGEVEGLLADVPAKMVRYVEIEVEDDVINRHTAGHYTDDDRHVLLPIGLLKINQADKSVSVYGVGMEHFIDYPRFNHSRGYTTSYELDTNNYLSGFHEFGKSYDRSMFDNDNYRHADSFDGTFYGSRFYKG